MYFPWISRKTAPIADTQRQNKIRSPSELRAMIQVKEQKENTEIEDAQKVAYKCVYEAINKNISKNLRLDGNVDLTGECLEAFRKATERFSTLPEHNYFTYGRCFDYRPFGWKKTRLLKKYSGDGVLYEFE